MKENVNSKKKTKNRFLANSSGLTCVLHCAKFQVDIRSGSGKKTHSQLQPSSFKKVPQSYTDFFFDETDSESIKAILLQYFEKRDEDDECNSADDDLFHDTEYETDDESDEQECTASLEDTMLIFEREDDITSTADTDAKVNDFFKKGCGCNFHCMITSNRVTLLICELIDTQFHCDWAFGLLKQKYKVTPASSMNELCDIVTQSTPTSKINQAIDVLQEKIPFYKWQQYFDSLNFKKIPNISKQSCFTFDSSKPNFIGTKEHGKDQNIVYHKIFDFCDNTETFPEVIDNDYFKMSYERKAYLYKNIRQYCNDDYKDVLCSKPRLQETLQKANDIVRSEDDGSTSEDYRKARSAFTQAQNLFEAKKKILGLSADDSLLIVCRVNGRLKDEFKNLTEAGNLQNETAKYPPLPPPNATQHTRPSQAIHVQCPQSATPLYQQMETKNPTTTINSATTLSDPNKRRLFTTSSTNSFSSTPPPNSKKLKEDGQTSIKTPLTTLDDEFADNLPGNSATLLESVSDLFRKQLDEEKTADEFVKTHQTININNRILDVRKLIAPAKKLILSNVHTCIPNSLILDALHSFKIKTVSAIFDLHINTANDKYDKNKVNEYAHIASFRRGIYVINEDDAQFPDSLLIQFDGETYRIFVNDSELRCHICQGLGHNASQCVENTENEVVLINTDTHENKNENDVQKASTSAQKRPALINHRNE
ncbi:hypothetical protein PGB90_006915 [Kerria lacca]